MIASLFCGFIVELLFVAGVEFLRGRHVAAVAVVTGVQWTAILYGVADHRHAYVAGCVLGAVAGTMAVREHESRKGKS